MKYSDYIKKEELLNYLNINKKISYKDALELLENKINSNKSFKKRFYNEYKVSYTPVEVEGILHCTKTERKQWTDEGKLKVVGYGSFKYGTFPLYDALFIDTLTDDKLTKWRDKHKNQVTKNRKNGAKKATVTKNENNKIREAEKLKITSEIKNWQQLDPIAAVIFELSYYTMWLSRWAKFYEETKYNSNDFKQEYNCNAKKESYYSLKEKSLRLLKQISEKYPQYFEFSFYAPNTVKILSSHLCDYHFEDFKIFHLDYFTKADIINYAFNNLNEISHCECCNFKIDDSYYWLYYIKVKCDNIPNISFSFHVPYSIGKNYLEEYNAYPVTNQKEQEGLFRFGRSLTSNELISHTEKITNLNFEKAYQNAMSLCLQ